MASTQVVKRLVALPWFLGTVYFITSWFDIIKTEGLHSVIQVPLPAWLALQIV